MSNKVHSLKLKHVKWLLIISYLIAFLLDNSLSIGISNIFIPSITILILIFWITNLQSETHFFTATILGILTDVTMNTLLGSHALILVILTFLILRVRQSFKNYPTWQQTFLVVFYLYIIQILSFFTLQPNLSEPQILYYWLSPLSTIFIWPITYKIMRLFTDKIET